MSEMTVEEYKARMRNVEMAEAKKGMKAHVIVTVLVSSLLVAINVTVTPEVIWSVFPLVGMSAGVALHYVLSTKFLEKEIVRKESMI